MNLQVEQLAVGPFEVNCFIIHAPGAGQAIVVDPGADAARISASLRRLEARVAYYLLTHGHVDHVSALAEVDGEFPAPVVLHTADARWAFTASNQIPPFYQSPCPPPVPPIFPDPPQLATFAGRCEIIMTPGHTPGGVCYYFIDQGWLFSGDTLFQGTVGRTDLPGGDTRQLAESVARLRQLPPQVMLYPGHGETSTMAAELATNPFLQDG